MCDDKIKVRYAIGTEFYLFIAMRSNIQNAHSNIDLSLANSNGYTPSSMETARGVQAQVSWFNRFISICIVSRRERDRCDATQLKYIGTTVKVDHTQTGI